MSHGVEYCGKSGEIKEKREYLEAESRGLGVSPSRILWGFLAGQLAGRLETWRNAKAEEGEIWKRLDGKSNVGEMPRGREFWQGLDERSDIGGAPR